MTHLVDVDKAAKHVTSSLEKVSVSFIVGGCVMLLAEEKGSCVIHLDIPGGSSTSLY